METALLAKLLATVAITALTGQRINMTRRPQGQAIPEGKAAIVLHRIDGAPGYHLKGASGVVESRMQVDCWAKDYLSAKATARAVEATLSGQAFTQGGIRFQGVFVDAERDSDFQDDTTILFRTSLDLMIHHSPAS